MESYVDREKVLVTSALPYANGPIHLGHLSGAYLPADIYVRYKRLNGDDVLYICGSDEHGVPITITADKEGVKPQVIIDRFHEINKKAFDQFGMSFDIYSRTSIPEHHETAKEFFTNYYNQKLLNEKKTFQFYDEKVKMFLPDRYVEGTCPRCKFEEARSDECESCGSLYDPSELLNPKSKITGETPKLKETSHWYFPLGKYQERLEKYIDEMNQKFGWKENVLQYCRGWFKDGLKDRAYTRDLDWGVKVPLENAEGKVLYVWFEAVLGYISATKELSEKRVDPELWKKYWQGPDTKYVAFIGKDNIVFHTIIFPAMLMAWNDSGNEQYVLPQNVPANEFLNFEGKKFSKSRGWGIDVIDFMKLFPADPLRYTLAANLPENKDTDFYWKEFQSRNNSELADILGNFINRTFIFANKHFENCVPEVTKLENIDEEMLNQLVEAPKKIASLLERYKIKDAVFEMMSLARKANKYFNDSEPWITVKRDKDKCASTVFVSLQTIFTLAEIFYPVIPSSSEKLFKMLNAEPVEWGNCGMENLKPGHKLNKAEILFKKIDDEVIEDQKSKMGNGEEEQVEQITIDDFSKVHLKSAKIIHADRIKKSEKLLKLQIDLGTEKRQVVAGIAKSYSPDELIGKRIIVVANLQPAKLFGIESQGMILAVENNEGGLNILETPENIEPGTRVK
ncbi:MAG: methionine--tRNA ligase [Melioribacteraceae bacterium]|nr:methionine--tRNA ligase [Melioribacteraceae bacterium]MCF8355314.1 methionine--tRNA ligase [Melioribacteraceae bacterium]MCF8395699.1 methionine--tRNA ligase [Melioribacteraceae bacterium]MCF8420392.1 methionine--tRNA ligase [Melioribacteraceae bacterium]